MLEGVIRARFSAREKKSNTSSMGRATNWVAWSVCVVTGSMPPGGG